MSIKNWIRIGIGFALLVAVLPAKPAEAMIPPFGCTLQGNSTCSFDCPPSVNGWILHVTAFDGGPGAIITGTCGSGAASCTVGGTGFCHAQRKTTQAGIGSCSLLGSPTAFGECNITVLASPHKPFCDGHVSPHSHTYSLGSSVGGKSDTVTGGEEVGAGLVTVSDNNVEDCDQDGFPGDFDGDYEAGVGGGFFGYGPWADEPTCNYGLTEHSGTVAVNDVVFGADIWFVIGADDTSGPAISVDPVTGETTCETDGAITPGDPATDPTADADDCLTEPQNLAQGVGTGATCGAGGDGGYWVFLSGALVSEGSGGASANNAPTAGTITA